jgi:hypothetical protein
VASYGAAASLTAFVSLLKRGHTLQKFISMQPQIAKTLHVTVPDIAHSVGEGLERYSSLIMNQLTIS